MKTNKLLKARENAGDHVAIVFSFASDWLRGWREFSGPITEQGWVKPKWSWISLYTHSKNRSSIGGEQLISMEYSRIEGDPQTFSNTSLDGAVLRQIYAKEQVTYRYHLPIIVDLWLCLSRHQAMMRGISVIRISRFVFFFLLKKKVLSLILCWFGSRLIGVTRVIVFGDGSILYLKILLYSLKSLPSAFRVQGCWMATNPLNPRSD